MESGAGAPADDGLFPADLVPTIEPRAVPRERARPREIVHEGPVRIARVLVDSALPQLDRLLDYRIPSALDGVAPGVRVTVPLRSAHRTATAYVVEIGEQRDFPGPLSDVVEVISIVPVLRPEVWRLARAVADRAAGSANDVLRLAIPTRQVRVEKAWLAREGDGDAPEVVAPALDGYAAGPLAERLAAGGRIALRVDPGVEQLPPTTNTAETTGAGGPAAPAVWVGRWALTLARAAARTVADGASAILVAPDYRDLDQLHAALRTVLPAESVVRLDAKQPNPERYRGMLRAAGPHPVAIVGTRSAVYAPAQGLGLLAVWNDGDPLLGEPLTPYVHARDAALVRHEQQGGALVFAGHTRTTDVQRLVELGWLEEIGPDRPRSPKVVPTANLTSQDRLAAQARIPSIAWRAAKEALANGPVLVQVARPGFAPGLRCVDCGAASRCTACTGPLRQRHANAVPACAWCGRLEPHVRCAECGSERFRPAGIGTRRTADELGRAFPGVRVVVSDGDRPLDAVDARPALVIATRGAEPIAAGGYAAVLLLDGDRMVARESLRVDEDVLRWWMDATALAADRATTVLVGVGGPLASAMATWQPTAVAHAELADRRTLRFPPAVRVASLLGAPDAIDEARRALPVTADVVGTTPQEDGRIRALIRFDYAAGAEVAAAVRSEVIRQATARRKPVPGQAPRGRQTLPLRTRFDDPEPFAE